MKNTPKNNYVEKAINILKLAREQAVRSVNQAMVFAYFELGKIIVEEEQLGNKRAEYSKQTIQELSAKLTEKFGKGYSKRNLEHIRRFYLVYSKEQILSIEAPNFQLSWSHYLTLVRIDNLQERKFYELEATQSKWSVRELKRQYDSALYTRLTLSRDKAEVKKLSEKGLIIENPKDAVKDPYILEFLGLPENKAYSESELEQELIDKLEYFLLELGNGFTFVARQNVYLLMTSTLELIWCFTIDY